MSYNWGRTMSEDTQLWRWLALEALSEESLEEAIVAIRAHIAEMGETTNPKPTKLLVQPGLLKQLGLTVKDVVKMIEKKPIPLYTKQEWQGLTDEEIHDCFQNRGRGSDGLKTRKMIAAAIEAMLKEKNT